jgi:hypothetical protein
MSCDLSSAIGGFRIEVLHSSEYGAGGSGGWSHRKLWTLQVLLTWMDGYKVNLKVLYHQCGSTGSRKVSREGDLE